MSDDFSYNFFMTNDTFTTMTVKHEDESLLNDPRFWVIVFALGLFVFRVIYGTDSSIPVIP
jgi:hypothetical protein